MDRAEPEGLSQTNYMARVPVNIPGWDKIDLASPWFEIKIED
jgi:hypothetical protein